MLDTQKERTNMKRKGEITMKRNQIRFIGYCLVIGLIVALPMVMTSCLVSVTGTFSHPTKTATSSTTARTVTTSTVTNTGPFDLTGMEINLPPPAGTSGLNSIWGTSDNDVFAVGNDGIILHYNGKSVSSMSSGTTDSLTGVWGTSPTNVFAVSSTLDVSNISHPFGIILHFDGYSWSPMSIWPNSDNITDACFSSIWGSSATDIWAVGPDNIAHYNGSLRWLPLPISGVGYLDSIWGSSGSDIFAVGNGGGVIEHFDGRTWIPMPYPSQTDDFTGVWGSSATDVFAVGSNPNTNSGVILHYNGNSWSSMYSGPDIGFWGVWGTSSTNVFAMGGMGSNSLLHYNGSSWSPMSVAPDPLHFYPTSIWGNSATDFFAVGLDMYGNCDTIMHYTK